MTTEYVEPESQFRTPSAYSKCHRRSPGRSCPNPPVADMKRGHSTQLEPSGFRWWAYCAEHLYGYRLVVHDGRVWRQQPA